MDPCKLTYCNACYHSNSTFPTPVRCSDCEDPLCVACIREWAICVEEINLTVNKVRLYMDNLNRIVTVLLVLTFSAMKVVRERKILNAMATLDVQIFS